MSDDRAARAIAELTRSGRTVATCESLTAGLLAATLATVPGASAVLRGGLITYATDLKRALAGVDAELLAARGPVDADVAAQMAAGARTACDADLALACTGVAGPAPQDGHPVGTVHIALASGDGNPVVRELALDGDRAAIRAATVEACLALLLEHL